MEIKLENHNGHKEFRNLNTNQITGLEQHFGEIQYFFKGEKGTIDLVYLRVVNGWAWEIFSKGIVFGSVEGFDTKEEAIKKICEYLDEDYNKTMEQLNKLEIVYTLE